MAAATTHMHRPPCSQGAADPLSCFAVCVLQRTRVRTRSKLEASTAAAAALLVQSSASCGCCSSSSTCWHFWAQQLLQQRHQQQGNLVWHRALGLVQYTCVTVQSELLPCNTPLLRLLSVFASCMMRGMLARSLSGHSCVGSPPTAHAQVVDLYGSKAVRYAKKLTWGGQACWSRM